MLLIIQRQYLNDHCMVIDLCLMIKCRETTVGFLLPTAVRRGIFRDPMSENLALVLFV